MSRTCNVNFMDRKAPGLQRGKQDQDNQVCHLVVPLSLCLPSEALRHGWGFFPSMPSIFLLPSSSLRASNKQIQWQEIQWSEVCARHFSGTTVPDEVHTHFAFNDALKTTRSFLFCRLWGRDSYNISPSLHLHALEKQRIGRQRALLLILF